MSKVKQWAEDTAEQKRRFNHISTFKQMVRLT